ncbi:unnamed protein product [Heligmosomoides polygyrus]|uniref:Tudor domain-containing protein n=1 Tax=Heligmosomoides polygyrus TaxID=6339 RepID=A0A183GB35_HELPZ|nr:unnamed protein product [Heligmosomoides polygyrus]
MEPVCFDDTCVGLDSMTVAMLVLWHPPTRSRLVLEFKVILTHFVALDEFYVRFTDEELVYERMLTELREDYKGKLEYTERQLWLKGDGVAVWQDRQWQRAVVCSPPTNATAAQTSSLDVFLIDVGKTVTISKDQVLPLHNFYHRPPFAVCCSVGHFDICRGRRSDLVEECDKMAASFLRAGVNALEAEIIGKIWDDKEKLQVRLLYRENQGVYVPDYFAEEKIIQLR